MPVLMSTFLYGIQLILLTKAIADLILIVDLSELQKTYWQQERLVRLCGALAALERNIEDGAKALEMRGPTSEDREAIRAGAAALKEKTWAHYQQEIHRCEEVSERFILVLQVHPGQPPIWPNWVARYQKGR